MRRATVEVDGRRARYIDAGAGPAVVLVHGLGLSGAVFHGHCRALAAAGFRAIAPDLPGFGRSDGPWRGLSVPETASWLLAFAAAIGVDRAIWLGHSLAAQGVLEAAVRAPARARALVLVTPTGAPGRCRLLRQVRSYLRDIGREPVSLIPIVARQYLRGSATAFLGTWLRSVRDHPVRKALRVRCPTLLVTGIRDPLVPDGFVALLMQRIPDARLATIHGAGHGITFDRSDEFDRVVIAFLRGVVDGAAPAAGFGAR
ncbi:MAG TPA: alpha/beta hydrolase [Longimicrobiales bacterium]